MATGSDRDVDGDAIEAAKRTLRHAVLFRRETRSRADRVRDDARRTDRVVEAWADRLPSTVAAYLSVGSEPATLQLVAWLASQDVRVLLPVLTRPGGDRLAAPAWGVYAGPDALREGRRDILEPTTAALPGAAVREAGLVLTPGLAANRAGDRLGRGGGWYDRVLVDRSADAPVWVLLNDDEVLPAIPTRPWDRPVDALVTPSGVTTCTPTAASH